MIYELLQGFIYWIGAMTLIGFAFLFYAGWRLNKLRDYTKRYQNDEI